MLGYRRAVRSERERADISESAAGQGEPLANLPEQEVLRGLVGEVIRYGPHVGPAAGVEDRGEDLRRFLGRANQLGPEALGLHGAGELGVLQAEGEDRSGGRAVGIAGFAVEDGRHVEVVDRHFRDRLLHRGLGHLQYRERAVLEDHVVLLADQESPPRRAPAHPAGEGHR